MLFFAAMLHRYRRGQDKEKTQTGDHYIILLCVHSEKKFPTGLIGVGILSTLYLFLLSYDTLSLKMGRTIQYVWSKSTFQTSVLHFILSDKKNALFNAGK